MLTMTYSGGAGLGQDLSDVDDAATQICLARAAGEDDLDTEGNLIAQGFAFTTIAAASARADQICPSRQPIVVAPTVVTLPERSTPAVLAPNTAANNSSTRNVLIAGGVGVAALGLVLWLAR